MKYGIQLYPHANQRYYESIKSLAISELLVITSSNKQLIKDVCYEQYGGLELLCFTSDDLSDFLLAKIYMHSSLLAIYEINDNHTLQPIMEKYATYFSNDIDNILKYKGKTNELFTDLMINVGVFSSTFREQYSEPLAILDPMCGKGTTMFKALVKGYHSAGIDIEKDYHLEIENFLKRYFKHATRKYSMTKTSYEILGKKRALKTTVDTSITNEHYKAKDTRSIQFVLGEGKYAVTYFGKKKFNVIVADLPYGVQHQGEDSGKRSSVLDVIDESLLDWISTLKVGGTIVLAYNNKSFSKEDLKSVLE
ncbi:MAG: hypothetical protein PF505_01550, partial [Vallitaleaceae bacterium]|nr:hypothetical protein [Vallitaleaceae bacterium]